MGLPKDDDPMGSIEPSEKEESLYKKIQDKTRKSQVNTEKKKPIIGNKDSIDLVFDKRASTFVNSDWSGSLRKSGFEPVEDKMKEAEHELKNGEVKQVTKFSS